MKLDEVAKILQARPLHLKKTLLKEQIRGFFIDSREVIEQGAFFAMKGRRVDAHSFAQEAVKKGALVAIVEREVGRIPSLLVQDTKEALLSLASFYRRKFDVFTIAVTGTNGKSTTKDMIAHILSKKFCTLKAERSLNNLLGVPLTILKLKEGVKFLILEIETNKVEETRMLCKLALPKVGVVTNIAPSHLQDTGSVKGVYEEKKEMATSLQSGGVLILNSDSAWAMKMRKETEAFILTFGIRNKAKFFARSVKLGERSVHFLLNGRWKVELNLAGAHNVYNALAALATIEAIGIDLEEGCAALSDFKLQPFRMQFLQRRGVRIVNDAYNANPHSVKVALDYLCAQSGRRIFVFGQMQELGEKEVHFHEWVGKMVAKKGIDAFFTIGKLSEHAARAAKNEGMKEVFHFFGKEEASSFLSSYLKVGDLLLFKASRAMELESLLDEVFK